MKKNILALLLLTAMLASAACGGSPSDTTDTTDVASDTTTAEETGVTDGLGEWDFGGDTFDMLTREYPLIHSHLNSAESNGDVLNDTIYDRNRRLEDRFHFTFTEAYYSSENGTNDYPRQFLLAGDTTYDLYTGRMIQFFNYAAEGMIIPAAEIPHINPDKEHWNTQLYNDLQVAGKYRFVVGDFNLSAADFTHVMLFNKTMAKNYQIENLYDTVRSGNWTFDKFAEISKSAISDLDGNQSMDENDQYGYVMQAKHVLPSFWIAARADLITKDEDGMLSYIAPENEKALNVLNRVYEMTWDGNVWHPNTADASELGIFRDERALFTGVSGFELTTELRDSEVEFGVLPYPKWDTAQKEYYSRIEGCELFGISYSNAKPEMAGVIMEAMAYDSYIHLRPAYYDTALKIKGTRDEDSVEMLEIIFKNRVFDYADTILCSEIRDGVLHKAFKANNRDLVSVLTGVAKKAQAKLDTYNSGFAANDK